MTTAVINTPVRTISLFASAYDESARARLDAIEAVTITGAGLATGGGDLTANRVITVAKASGAEAAAGANDTKAVTPLALATPLATLQTAIEQEIADRIIGDASAPENLEAHLDDFNNPHHVTKAQVNLGNADNTADAAKPISTATQAALNLKAPLLSPPLIGVPTAPTAVALTNTNQIATTSFATLGDGVVNAALVAHTSNTSNPHSVTKTHVGLSNVDNTSDVNKPISTATQAAINAVEASGASTDADLAAHLSDTSNPHSVTKTQINLGNVDDTSDINKPVSTAQQIAINLNANIASPTFTGIPAAPTPAPGTNTTQISTTAFVTGAVAVVAAAEAAHEADVNNPHDVNKAQVNLGNVDNVSDVNKPISIAAQAALDLKAPLASPPLTGIPTAATAAPGTSTTQLATTAFSTLGVAVVNTALGVHVARVDNPHAVTAAHVGLGSVNNTADLAKPVSTAQATAIAVVQADADAAQTDATFALTQLLPIPSLIERASERPGDAWAIFGIGTQGEQADIATINPAWIVNTAAGNVLRVEGTSTPDPQIVAFLGAHALIAGMMYEIRYKVQRFTDPIDPLNDSVTCAIQWLDNDKIALGGSPGQTTIEDIALVVADGVEERICLVSTIPSDDGSVVVPPGGTVYFRPFIAMYGDIHVTDVIHINVRTIADNRTIVGDIDDNLEELLYPPYTLVAPTDGQTIFLTETKKTILNPSGVLGTLTLSLPNSADKREIRVSTRQRIDLLTVTAAGGRSVDWDVGELPQNGIIDFTIVGSLNRWVRV